MLLIVQPLPFAGVTATRGVDAALLASPDPREVWADAAVGSEARIDADLGGARSIDTVWLGAVTAPAAGATWRVEGALGSGAAFVIQPTTTLRVPDVAGRFEPTSSALWHGAPVTIERLSIYVAQPAGQAPLTAGRLIVGSAFVAAQGREWGAGRRPIDTGSVTALSSGGFATVDGVRKRYVSWTFGDLSAAEVDQLEAIAMDLGETRPVLVVDDPSPTPGLRTRIVHGRFDRWKAFERRDPARTKWEMGIEEWL